MSGQFWSRRSGQFRGTSVGEVNLVERGSPKGGKNGELAKELIKRTNLQFLARIGSPPQFVSYWLRVLDM